MWCGMWVEWSDTLEIDRSSKLENSFFTHLHVVPNLNGFICSIKLYLGKLWSLNSSHLLVYFFVLMCFWANVVETWKLVANEAYFYIIQIYTFVLMCCWVNNDIIVILWWKFQFFIFNKKWLVFSSLSYKSNIVQNQLNCNCIHNINISVASSVTLDFAKCIAFWHCIALLT